MTELASLAASLGTLLKERKETIGIAESSTGGLISAALLAVPGASAYFLGGGVIYTQAARRALLQLPDASLQGVRSSTEAYALLKARAIRQLLGTTWAWRRRERAGRRATATATRRVIAASPSWVRWNAPSRWRPATVIASATCGRLPGPRWICLKRRCESPRGGLLAKALLYSSLNPEKGGDETCTKRLR
jgi:hypothetical protein